MTRYELVNHLLESDSELSFQDPRSSLTSSDALVARCTHRQRIALFVAVSGFIVVLTIMAIVIFTGLRATPSYNNPTDPGMARLPGDISPIHYDLSLETDMDRFTYNGTVNIRITVCILARHLLTFSLQALKPTNQVILHARELNISAITLRTDLSTAPAAATKYLASYLCHSNSS